MKRGILLVLATLLAISGCATQNGFTTNASQLEPAGAKSTGNFTPKLSTAFDQDWPLDVSRDELIETALYKLFRDLDQIRVDDCGTKAHFYLGAPLLEEHHYLIESVANGMVQSFCRYLREDIPVVAGSYDFLKEVVRSEGFQSDDFGGICGFDLQEDWASACAVYGVAWTGISLGSTRNGAPFVEERRLTIAAHELFHIVHDQINPQADPGTGDCLTYSCAGPVWFYEGAGEFFGRAMTQYLGLQNYATFVPTDRNGLFLDGAYLSDLDFLTQRRNKAGGTENYYSGQVAMEMLIANRGLLQVMEIWEKLDQGIPFPEAFEQAMGIGLDDFYSKFKILHGRLYAEQGYCDKGLGCDEWVKSDQEQDWYRDSRKVSLDDMVDPSEAGPVLSAGVQLLETGCLEANEIWWSKCTELEYGIPNNPENSDHGYPLGYNEIAKIASCDEMTLIGFNLDGWAVTFEAREASGASRAKVSTQYYAALRYLDLNLDGVVCSSQAPD